MITCAFKTAPTESLIFISNLFPLNLRVVEIPAHRLLSCSNEIVLSESSRASIAKWLPFLKSSHRIVPTLRPYLKAHPPWSLSFTGSTLPPLQVALNACTAATLKIYVYVFCKSREAGYGVVATDITSVKEVANSSLSHETSYRQANCISLSKALSIVSKYSPLYSSFEIFVADRPLSAWLHSYG